ncbi:hypothetical protein AB1H94_17700 [Pseudomonas fulva]|uniref:hypothetical protein n=1 Tax=Pseudomonas fulva TaxID=47880 RepID=UPI00345DF6D8
MPKEKYIASGIDWKYFRGQYYLQSFNAVEQPLGPTLFNNQQTSHQAPSESGN